MTDSDEKSKAADIPEDARHMITLFLSTKSKERLAYALSERDRTHLAHVILYIMTISEHALEEVKETECFKSALAFANSSIEGKAISPDLEAMFEANKDKLLQEVNNNLDALKAKLLGRQKRDYDRLLSLGRTDCAERLLAGARKKRRNSDYIETYKNLQRACGELKRDDFSLSLDLLGGTLSGKSMAPYVSFLVCNPERLAFSLIFTKPEWGTFPMKWASIRLPISTLYDLWMSTEEVKMYRVYSLINMQLRMVLRILGRLPRTCLYGTHSARGSLNVFLLLKKLCTHTRKNCSARAFIQACP